MAKYFLVENIIDILFNIGYMMIIKKTKEIKNINQHFI